MSELSRLTNEEFYSVEGGGISAHLAEVGQLTVHDGLYEAALILAAKEIREVEGRIAQPIDIQW